MEQAATGANTLLESIAEFCRNNAMAESTFGRQAVNDGKFVTRIDAPANDNNTGYTGHLEDSSPRARRRANDNRPSCAAFLRCRPSPTGGLVYMQARYYDPLIGRFYSTDPIGYQDQLNLYAYVGNDPVNATDPTGEFGLVGGVVGGAIGFVFEAGRQAIIHKGDISKFSGATIAAATLTGAAVGATAGLAAGVVGLTGATGAGAVATVALPTTTVAATGAGITTAIDNIEQGNDPNQNVLTNMATSAVTAPLGAMGTGKAVDAFSKSVTQGGGQVLKSATTQIEAVGAATTEAATRTIQSTIAEPPPVLEEDNLR